MTKKNILIFPCGSEIGLEINRALANDIHFEMFGASSLPDHGKFVYKNYIEDVPFVDKANFIDGINKICEKYKIDYIFPKVQDMSNKSKFLILHKYFSLPYFSPLLYLYHTR